MEYKTYKIIGIIGLLLEIALVAFAIGFSWLHGWEPVEKWRVPMLVLCFIGFLGLGVPLYCLEYVRTHDREAAKRAVVLVYAVLAAILIPSLLRHLRQ